MLISVTVSDFFFSHVVFLHYHKCLYNWKETMFSINFLLENMAEKKNSLFTLIIKMQILSAHTVTTSTAHGSSVHNLFS